MKKKRAKIWIIIAAVIGVILLVAVINFYPMLSMKPLSTGLIPGTDIYAVRTNINDMFLIKTAGGYIAIDAGASANAVQRGLEQLKIDAADIFYVLLTHSDFDHTAALGLFANAQICLGEDELQLLDGSAKRNSSGANSLPEGIDIQSLGLLYGGQMLYFGEDTILCLKAPGHTPGSMLYVLNGAYIFSGDAFRVSGKTIKTHPFTMDEEQSLLSISLIDDMLGKSRMVFTAHYGVHPAADLYK